jgi:hypothetical protein
MYTIAIIIITTVIMCVITHLLIEMAHFSALFGYKYLKLKKKTKYIKHGMQIANIICQSWY